MANNKDFKIKNSILSEGYLEGIGTVSTSTEGYSLSAASYDNVSFSVSSQELVPQDLFFKPDGTKMYIAGGAGDDINEYDLSTA